MKQIGRDAARQKSPTGTLGSFENRNETGSAERFLRAHSERCPFGPILCGTKDAVFTSGIVGAGNTIRASTFDALNHLVEMLRAKGFEKGDVVKVRAFLRDMGASERADFSHAYMRFFSDVPGKLPVLECVHAKALPGNAHAQISLIASSEEKTEMRASGQVSAPGGTVARGLSVGNIAYLAGRFAGATSTEEQVASVLKQIESALWAGKMTMADVAKANVFVKNFDADFPIVNKAFSEVFKAGPPARETVEMARIYPVDVNENMPVDINIAISVIAGRNKQAINAPDAPAPVGPYSHAVRLGNMLLLSGQICREGDVEQQTSTILANLEKVLRAGDASPQEVVSATVYLSELHHREKITGQLLQFFGEKLPAVEFVRPAKLPFGVDVEISCVALKPENA
ncbi:MAG: RidA family protein [Candidatus Burarchaeum sp.]|nr:RidA family protein [Candidatus Burarchaeum sp.]MDO8340342.1 RidA family protein [Candidatus Burarchaeum sp.]